MPSLAVGWEYLTGYAVATDWTNRDRAEWPPHPGRVFLALAAAHFETGEDPAERDALRWLEALGDPELHLPPSNAVFERTNVTVYVPVNDKAGPSAAMLQSAPTTTRSRQARTFPRVWVGSSPCYMTWQDAGDLDKHRAALEQVCTKVTRIGHSSSLVRMWVADEVDPRAGEHWQPDDLNATVHCRVVSKNTLGSLPEQTQIPLINDFAHLAQRVASSKRAEQKLVKTEFEGRFGKKWKRGIAPPPLLRPNLGIWRGYRSAGAHRPDPDVAHSNFDTDLLILSHTDGPQLPLVSTLAASQALRNTIMKHSGEQPVPSWVSGHDPNGTPLHHDSDAHLALTPLPFVGRSHADGHLLGMGLAFPRSTNLKERGRVLGALLLNEHGKPKPVALHLGRLGAWTLTKRDWTESRRALQPETWTAHSRGSQTWASVTPVVLDKFPKSSRRDDRAAWTDEVARIVASSCERIGLPLPDAIDLDTTSWVHGSSRAVRKQRQLRSGAGSDGQQGTGCGDGFPPYPPKGTNVPRLQVHVWLRFPEPVVGPILLGAGRYRGYGLCMPWKEADR